MEIDVPIPVVITIMAVALYFAWRFYKPKLNNIKNMTHIPEIIHEGGFDVPVLAAFIGLRHLPRKANVAHNNINPSLVLFEDRLECKVISKKTISISEIEKADIWDTVGTKAIFIYVRNQEKVFIANLLNKYNLAQVLKYLKKRGAILSPRAEKFLAKY